MKDGETCGLRKDVGSQEKEGDTQGKRTGVTDEAKIETEREIMRERRGVERIEARRKEVIDGYRQGGRLRADGDGSREETMEARKAGR